MTKHWKKAAATMAVLAIGATGAATAWANQQAPAPQTKSLGGATMETKFVPIKPCRILDTRKAGGEVPPKYEHSIVVRGDGPVFAAQGGKPGGCGVPAAATAVEATVHATDPAGKGYLRVYPGPVEDPATFVTYASQASNTGAIALCVPGDCVADVTKTDLSFTTNEHATQVVIEVQGYYIAPMAATLTDAGQLVDARSSRVRSVLKTAVGEYAVSFDTDVRSCVYSTNVPELALISAAPGANPEAVVVRIADNEGAPTDLEFSLQVTC